jgi:hypothetical protein
VVLSPPEPHGTVVVESNGDEVFPLTCDLLIFNIKDVSNEKDPAENKVHSKGLYKRERRGACPPSCESPLKIPRHLLQQLAMVIRILIANGAHSSVCGLLFTTYSCWQWRFGQIWKL